MGLAQSECKVLAQRCTKLQSAQSGSRSCISTARGCFYAKCAKLGVIRAKKDFAHSAQGEKKILIKHGMRKILPNSQIRPFTGSQSVFMRLTGKNTMKAIKSRQRGTEGHRGAFWSRGRGRTAHRVQLWDSGAAPVLKYTLPIQNLYPSLPVTDERGAYWREQKRLSRCALFSLPFCMKHGGSVRRCALCGH